MSDKYVNGKAVCNCLIVGNSSVCPICRRLRDINCRNVHGLEPDLLNGPRSNINMPVERPHATSDVLTFAMFALSVSVCEIITYELSNVCDSNHWPWKWSRSSVICTKIGWRVYIVNWYMFATIGASRSSVLVAVHNRIFRYHPRCLLGYHHFNSIGMVQNSKKTNIMVSD